MTRQQPEKTKRCGFCRDEVKAHFRVLSAEVARGWIVACPRCGVDKKTLGSWTRCFFCGKLLWQAFNRVAASIVEVEDYPGVHGEQCMECVRKELISELEEAYAIEPSRLTHWLLKHERYIIPRLKHVYNKVKETYPGITLGLQWIWRSPWFSITVENAVSEEQADEIFDFANHAWHEPVHIYHKLFLYDEIINYGADVN